jgi:hypothetical protein
MQTGDALDAELVRLQARLLVLKREHEALHTRPHDRRGHEAHLDNLLAYHEDVRASANASPRAIRNHWTAFQETTEASLAWLLDPQPRRQRAAREAVARPSAETPRRASRSSCSARIRSKRGPSPSDLPVRPEVLPRNPSGQLERPLRIEGPEGAFAPVAC